MGCTKIAYHHMIVFMSLGFVHGADAPRQAACSCFDARNYRIEAFKGIIVGSRAQLCNKAHAGGHADRQP